MMRMSLVFCIASPPHIHHLGKIIWFLLCPSLIGAGSIRSIDPPALDSSSTTPGVAPIWRYAYQRGDIGHADLIFFGVRFVDRHFPQVPCHFTGHIIITRGVLGTDRFKRPCLEFGFTGQLNLPPVAVLVEIDCPGQVGGSFVFSCFLGHHFSFDQRQLFLPSATIKVSGY